MRTLPAQEVAKHLQYHFDQLGLDITKGPCIEPMIPVLAEKAKTLKELAQQASYFYHDFDTFDEKQAKKHLTSKSQKALSVVMEKLAQLTNSDWQYETKLHQALKDTAGELSLGMGKVGMPVRVAITGSGQSPGIGITLKWIGKARVLQRLQKAIDYIANPDEIW